MTAQATIAEPAHPAQREAWAWVNVWTIGTVVIAAAVMAPIVAIVFIGLTPQDNIWGHLAATVLPTYLGKTLQLMIGVGLTPWWR